MKKLIILFSFLLLSTITEAQIHICTKVGEDWIFNYELDSIANKILVDSSASDSVQFNRQSVTLVGSDYIVNIHGYCIDNHNIAYQIKCTQNGDFIDFVNDTCTIFCGTTCQTQYCCSSCIQNGTTCTCKVTTCSGATCEMRTFTFMPAGGMSDAIMQRLTD